jgi:hypothetical protein
MKLTLNGKGARRWTLDGKLHRLDGPAAEYADGYRSWWVAGRRHRTDGPAVEYASGSREWWVDGTQIKVWRNK